VAKSIFEGQICTKVVGTSICEIDRENLDIDLTRYER
jgi:hypothetical protein